MANCSLDIAPTSSCDPMFNNGAAERARGGFPVRRRAAGAVRVPRARERLRGRRRDAPGSPLPAGRDPVPARGVRPAAPREPALRDAPGREPLRRVRGAGALQGPDGGARRVPPLRLAAHLLGQQRQLQQSQAAALHAAGLQRRDVLRADLVRRQLPRAAVHARRRRCGPFPARGPVGQARGDWRPAQRRPDGVRGAGGVREGGGARDAGAAGGESYVMFTNRHINFANKSWRTGLNDGRFFFASLVDGSGGDWSEDPGYISTNLTADQSGNFRMYRDYSNNVAFPDGKLIVGDISGWDASFNDISCNNATILGKPTVIGPVDPTALIFDNQL